MASAAPAGPQLSRAPRARFGARAGLVHLEGARAAAAVKVTWSAKWVSRAPLPFCACTTGWLWKATPENISPLLTPLWAGWVEKTNWVATISAGRGAVLADARPLEVALKTKGAPSLLAEMASPAKAARPLLQLIALMPDRVGLPLVMASATGVPDR